MTYQAAQELTRIATLSAFNIITACKREKLNQHGVLYTFSDGSRLCIRTTSGQGDAWHPKWCGTTGDTDLRPIMGFPISVTRSA